MIRDDWIPANRNDPTRMRALIFVCENYRQQISDLSWLLKLNGRIALHPEIAS